MEAASPDGWSAADSAAIMTAEQMFLDWVADVLDHRHLNDVDTRLATHCGPGHLARWVHGVWDERVPHLASIRVSGPARAAADGHQRPEVVYPPPESAVGPDGSVRV